MAAYAEYDYYHGTFLGVAISETNFPRLALRASELIDEITFNRAFVVIDADIPVSTVTAIQNAVCALAEEIQSEELEGNLDGIASESTGSHSISYNAKSRAGMTNHEKQTLVAKKYLGNTGLMFSGFANGEYGGQVAEE